MPGTSRLAALALALCALSAGCVTRGADLEESTAAPAPEPAGPLTPFTPTFALVAPEVLVDAPDPILPGDPVRLRATFPAEAQVDPTKIADVLWYVGVDFEVGPDISVLFAEAGRHEVILSVRDVYDRTARTTFHVPVAHEARVDGIVLVGTAGADARPADGGLPHDHEDHALPVLDGARLVRVTLDFAPTRCAQPPACLDVNLVLRILGPDGTVLAEAADGPPPRVLEVAPAGAGEHVVRISGDRGVDVAYGATALVLYGGD